MQPGVPFWEGGGGISDPHRREGLGKAEAETSAVAQPKDSWRPLGAEGGKTQLASPDSSRASTGLPTSAQ